MTYSELKCVVACLCVALVAAAACKKSSPPQAIPPDKAPAALQQAFAKAKPEVKQLADQVVAAMQNQEFAKAHVDIQGLCALPALTDEQRRVATACLLTLGEQLQTAQARGDAKAAEAVKLHLLNK